MTKEELRQQASISMLSSILETTKHSVIECLAKDVYAYIAVAYADALVNALDKEPEEIIEHLKLWKIKKN